MVGNGMLGWLRGALLHGMPCLLSVTLAVAAQVCQSQQMMQQTPNMGQMPWTLTLTSTDRPPVDPTAAAAAGPAAKLPLATAAPMAVQATAALLQLQQQLLLQQLAWTACHPECPSSPAPWAAGQAAAVTPQTQQNLVVWQLWGSRTTMRIMTTLSLGSAGTLMGSWALAGQQPAATARRS